MKIIKPNYFDEFFCLASDCKNTCCANWEIEIDNKSLLKYSNTTNLENTDNYSIKKNNNYIFKTQNNRCVFLDNDNLCKIVKKFGNKYLCEVCMEFPRFYINLKTYSFIGLGLDCENVVNIVLNLKQNILFNITETNRKFDKNEDLKFEKFMSIINLLNSTTSFDDAVLNILKFLNYQNTISKNNSLLLLINQDAISKTNFEWQNDNAKNIFKFASQNISSTYNFSNTQLKNLFISFLYKHYFDTRIKNNEKETVLYSLYMTLCCNSLMLLDKFSINENISCLVRQIEDNYQNMLVLFDIFSNN